MENLPQQAAELEVEQMTMGRLEGVGPPTEVDGDSTTEMEGDHTTGVTEGCRPSGTWAKRPQ
jgi:hypothetical protein